MTSITKQACEPLGVKPRDADRSKNFFALGLISWMYTRPEQPTIDWINTQVRGEAPGARRQPGRVPGRARLRRDRRAVRSPVLGARPRPSCPGTYTNISGNTAMAWGLIAATQLSGLPLFLGSYPITPASDILHELSKHKNFGVRTLQAEDEIAGIGAALGASYGGHLGVHHHQRAGRGAQGRDHRSGHQPRAAAADHRHPAGRSVDRAAHQDRAGRPADGHVRPPRRVAPADHRLRTARRTASRSPSRRPASR